MAVIHPITPEANVQLFLDSTGWGNIADEAFTFDVVDRGELT